MKLLRGRFSRGIILLLCLSVQTAVLADTPRPPPEVSPIGDQSDAGIAVIQRLLDTVPQNNLAFLNTTPSPLLKQAPQWLASLKHRYLHYYFSPWTDPSYFFSVKGIGLTQGNAIDFYSQHPGWGENQQPYSSDWVQHLAHNMNIAAYPNERQAAITIRATYLRVLPTDQPSFVDLHKAGQGYPFDSLQMSILRANLPVYILHTTRDGAWKLVTTPDYDFGWVNSQNLAVVDKPFIRRWRQVSRYVVVTQDDAPLMNAYQRLYFKTRVGELFPLVAEKPHSYWVYVAVADSRGHAVIRRAYLNKKHALPFPQLLTQKGIATEANQLIGTPYGWGDAYGYRDCSSTVKDLFTVFGLWLPRNSGDQSHSGRLISFKNLTAEQRRQLILDQGIPFATLIWIPGHVMLYVGSRDQMPYAFHAPWGLHTEDPTSHEEGRLVIGRSVITPLNIGAGLPSVKQTYLDRAGGMVLLLPPTEPSFLLKRHPGD